MIINLRRQEFRLICTHSNQSSFFISGRDLQSQEHGTWLGINSNGKIGALLNISDKPLISDVQSRGALVTEYLKKDIEPCAYIQKLKKNGQIFNGYNLLLFDLMYLYYIAQLIQLYLRL